jgi:hypothetical protein
MVTAQSFECAPGGRVWAMNRVGRPQRWVLLVAAAALLIGLSANAGHDSSGGRFEGQSGVLGTGALVGPGPAGAPDTRLQRDVGFGQRHLGSRVDGIGGPRVQAPVSQAWGAAPPAAIERAEHPERVGPVLLRGPPALSA